MNENELQTLVDQHGTLTAVAKHLGVTQQALSYLIKKYRMTIQFDQNRRGKKGSYLDQYAPLLKHLASIGWNCRRIADVIDEPYLNMAESIRMWLHKNGVAILSRVGAQPGERNIAFVDGQYQNDRDDMYTFVPAPKGYKGRKKSNGWVAEHRIVMEKKLGRLLDEEEVVHHEDENPRNNDPDNLRVFPSQLEHKQYHFEKWKASYAERLKDLQLADRQYAHSLGWGPRNGGQV